MSRWSEFCLCTILIRDSSVESLIEDNMQRCCMLHLNMFFMELIVGHNCYCYTTFFLLCFCVKVVWWCKIPWVSIYFNRYWHFYVLYGNYVGGLESLEVWKFEYIRLMFVTWVHWLKTSDFYFDQRRSVLCLVNGKIGSPLWLRVGLWIETHVDHETF